jgi:hypothetical protein
LLGGLKLTPPVWPNTYWPRFDAVNLVAAFFDAVNLVAAFFDAVNLKAALLVAGLTAAGSLLSPSLAILAFLVVCRVLINDFFWIDIAELLLI